MSERERDREGEFVLHNISAGRWSRREKKKAFFFFFFIFYTLGLLLQHTPDIWRRWLLLRRRRRRQPYRPVPLHHGQVPDSNSSSNSSSSHKLSHGQKWRGALYSSSYSRKQQQTHTHTDTQAEEVFTKYAFSLLDWNSFPASRTSSALTANTHQLPGRCRKIAHTAVRVTIVS